MHDLCRVQGFLSAGKLRIDAIFRRMLYLSQRDFRSSHHFGQQAFRTLSQGLQLVLRHYEGTANVMRCFVILGAAGVTDVNPEAAELPVIL